MASKHNLSARLRQVVDLCSQGLTDKHIAAEMGISSKTVDSHWKRLREAFGSSGRAHIVAQVLANDFDIDRKILQARVETLNQKVNANESQHNGYVARIAELEANLRDRNKIFADINKSLYLEMADRQALMERTKRLGHILEATKIYFYWTKAEPPFTCVFMSEGIRAFGWSPEQWTTGEVTMVDAIHPDDISAIYELLPERIKSGKETASCQFRLIDGYGKEHWVLERNRLELGDDGKPWMFSGCIIDLTDDIAEERWPYEGFNYWF